MTPAARLSAAIGILDAVLAGEAAEKALTNWARGARYAGARDRAAVRDLVFDGLRCRRSHAALGGAETGRGIVLGGLRERGEDPAALFTGEGHAPAPLSDAERLPQPAPEGFVALDCPDWLAPELQRSLGADFEPVMQALRARAAAHLRANLRLASRDAAIDELGAEGIACVAHPLSPSAIEAGDGARRIHMSAAYREGRVELQDAASQAVADLVPIAPGARVLDYCAGGGGKTLAMAARADARFFAHDADPRRMSALPERAGRAGVEVTLIENPATAAPFDVVLCDVPCSGSGTWRRSPEAKWRLTPARLVELCAIQAEILRAAARLVRPGGVLVYATCSLLAAENADQVRAFLSGMPGWQEGAALRLTPLDGADGFFAACLHAPAEAGTDKTDGVKARPD